LYYLNSSPIQDWSWIERQRREWAGIEIICYYYFKRKGLKQSFIHRVVPSTGQEAMLLLEQKWAEE
jgi:hypothetical protein